MRAVMTRVDEHFLARRRERGADRWDEMWGGELHMVPSPNVEHQDFLGRLYVWLLAHVERQGRGPVYLDINVAPPGGWPDNFRVPDLSFIAAGAMGRFVSDGACYEGPPATVFEIASPGQEAEEKLPFYAALGVPEAVVLGRDDKRIAVHVLAGDRYESQRPDNAGWYLLERLGVEIRKAPAASGEKPAVELRAQGAGDLHRV